MVAGRKLEVCVDSLESALNAINGGAHRLELCSALSLGGLTPTTGLLRLIKRYGWERQVPIFCMIRPRAGHFAYSPSELEQAAEEMAALKMEGADGFVFGALDAQGLIDRHSCQTLLNIAKHLPCTFHRAFDLVPDPLAAQKILQELQFTRVLTSGQAATAPQGAKLLAKLVKSSRDLIVMPGAGLNPENLAEIIKSTKASEYHASASDPSSMSKISKSRTSLAKVIEGDADEENPIKVTSEEKVRLMVSLLKHD